MINNVILKNTVKEKTDNTTKVTTTVLTVNTKKMSKAETDEVLKDLYTSATKVKTTPKPEELSLQDKEFLAEKEKLRDIETAINTTPTIQVTKTQSISSGEESEFFEEQTPPRSVIDYNDSKYSNLAKNNYTLNTNAIDDSTLIYVNDELIYTNKEFTNLFKNNISLYSNSLGDTFISNTSESDVFVKIETLGKGESILSNSNTFVTKQENFCSFWLSVNTTQAVEQALRQNKKALKSRCILAHSPLKEDVTLTIKLNNEVLGIIENYKSPEQIATYFDNKEISNLYFYNSSSNQVIVFNRYLREQQLSFQTKEQHIDLTEYWDKEDEGVFVQLPKYNLTVFKLGNYLS